MPELIAISSDTVDQLLPDLPRMVRLALGYGSKLQRGTLDVTLPDGRTVRLGGNGPGPAAAMNVHDFSFASRLLRGGDIGIAEAYLRGEWETPDLTQFLYLFCVNQDWMQKALIGNPVIRSVQIIRHWFNRNTRRQARRNIYAHYDIGNAFYSAWLDPSMTYSSALYEDHTPDLTSAQNNKYRRLAEAIDLRPDQKLLEIGCGWGGFAEFAAKQGARVVGLTISKEQRDFAQRRIQQAGLSEKVEIRLQDYRDERGQYDRIASIEMIEAVGEQFWPNYFSQLRDRLLPGGLAGIQAITIQDSLFQTYRQRGRLHPALRFSGRHAALAAGAEGARREVRRARHSRAHFWGRLCQDAFDLAKQFPRGVAEPEAARLRRPLQAACGNTTSPIAKPDSCREISTCVRSCSPNPDDTCALWSACASGGGPLGSLAQRKQPAISKI